MNRRPVSRAALLQSFESFFLAASGLIGVADAAAVRDFEGSAGPVGLARPAGRAG